MSAARVQIHWPGDLGSKRTILPMRYRLAALAVAAGSLALAIPGGTASARPLHAAENQAGQAGDEAGDCRRRPLRIPPRAEDAPSGAQFARTIAALPARARDEAIVAQLLSGNVPSFLRTTVPISLDRSDGSGPHRVTLCVMPDYLAVGSDSDYLMVPMALPAAATVSAAFGASLPTRRIVDAIYAQASVRLRPHPLPPGEAMQSIAYYSHHSDLIRQQRRQQRAPPQALVAGHKKDLVLTNRLWTNRDRVAIYGWHRESGAPIQPLSTVHGASYADYSHGVRLVAATAWRDGEAVALLDLLDDPSAARLLSDEGPLRRPGALLSAHLPPTVLQQRNPRW